MVVKKKEKRDLATAPRGSLCRNGLDWVKKMGFNGSRKGWNGLKWDEMDEN